MKVDMVEIDVSNWSLLSERLASKSYVSPDGEWMMKFCLASEKNDVAALEEEQEISGYVDSLGIPTPAAGGLVEVKGGGVGSLYQYIPGKKSLSRAISEDASLLVPYMRKFRELGDLIHSTPCERSRFVPIKDRMKAKLPLATMYSEREKARISDFLDAIPECGSCLHGDFHPGNFIVSPSGVHAIDLGLFSYGDAIYDWANWYFLSHYFAKYESVFHLDKETLLKCWEESSRGIGYDEEQVSILASFYALNYIGIKPTVMNTLENNKKLNAFFR